MVPKYRNGYENYDIYIQHYVAIENVYEDLITSWEDVCCNGKRAELKIPYIV